MLAIPNSQQIDPSDQYTFVVRNHWDLIAVLNDLENNNVKVTDAFAEPTGGTRLTILKPKDPQSAQNLLNTLKADSRVSDPEDNNRRAVFPYAEIFQPVLSWIVPDAAAGQPESKIKGNLQGPDGSGYEGSTVTLGAPDPRIDGKLEWGPHDGQAPPHNVTGPSGNFNLTFPPGGVVLDPNWTLEFSGDWNSRQAKLGDLLDPIGTSTPPSGKGPQCTPGVNTLCVKGNRFQIKVDRGDASAATAVPMTDKSGAFRFGDAENPELLIKVLDGCKSNNNYWVFTVAATDVEYTLTVTDTQTGSFREYSNPLGQTAPPILDTEAFATCP